MCQNYPKTCTDIQCERERKKYESRDVRIQAKLKGKNEISIALLHTGRADCVCSHTRKLPIIYPDTEADREKEREIEKVVSRSAFLSLSLLLFICLNIRVYYR